MSNTIGYSLGGCVTGVKYNLTQGEDATGNTVAFSLPACIPGCLNADYRERRYWAQIPISATATSGTDYYGALAPSLKFQGEGTYRDICPTVCYCEGPTEEGATVTKYLDRYETRWMALLEEGRIYYGRVDGALIQAPLDLFPDPLSDTATHIALSFDANARPVFAYEDGGTIYIHRYVAGVPTTYSWMGTDPCLFFNGVINYDDTLTDVVCYYLTEAGGALYARVQRENFGVANLVLEDSGLTSLQAVDRGRGALASCMVIELAGKRIFAAVYPPWPILAAVYPPWPILAEDSLGSSVACLTGALSRTVWSVGEYDDAISSGVSPLHGVHRAVVVVTLETETDAIGSSVGPISGTHRLVLVTLATESDLISSTTSPVSGTHKLVLVQAGTYSDTVASATSPLTGAHTHV